jgi:hypothetical protein
VSSFGPSAPVRVDVARSDVRPAAAGPARAHLVVSRIDPWSATKLGFVLSVALGIVLVVATAVLWAVLVASGAPDAVDRLANQVLAGGGFHILSYVSLGRVLGAGLLLALVNVVLLTALSAVAAVLYNSAGGIVGGLRVTLREGDD